MNVFTKAVFEFGPDAIAADPAGLGQAASVDVALTNAPFTPTPALDLATMQAIQADFATSTSKTVGSVPQATARDPATQDYVLTINPPAGGWRWETTALTNLPQTVYGFFVWNTDSGTLLATGLLDAPVILSEVNQQVEIPVIEFRFLQSGVV